MEIIIGEGKEKFDKLKIIGNFDELAQKIDIIHNQNVCERNFIFRKDKKTDICELIDDTYDTAFGYDSEILVFQNPTLLSLDKKEIPLNKKECLELFIGIESNGGLKYTIYNIDKFDVKNLMKVLNSINGIGNITICNSIFIWVNGRIRTFKMEYKELDTNRNIQI